MKTSTPKTKSTKGTTKPRNATPLNNSAPLKSDKENGVTPKVNAFQFMMNSRHKSLGSNSSGKEVDLDESLEDFQPKQDLKTRKKMLKKWAEKKGAKRKREYEEVGQTIEYKLEVRERRFKKLLNVECQSDDEVVVKRRKRGKVNQNRDSEVGNDGKGDKLNINVKSWKFKIKLCMDANKDLEEEQEMKEDEVGTLKDDIEESKSEKNDELVEVTKEENDCPIVEIKENKKDRRIKRSKPIYDDSDDEQQQKIDKCKVALVKSLPKTKVELCTDANKDLKEKIDEIDQEMKEHEDTEENKDNKIEQGNEESFKATKEENDSLIVETNDGQRKLGRRQSKRIYDDSDDREQQKKNKCKVAPIFVKSLPKTKVEHCTDVNKDLKEKTDQIDQEMKEHEAIEENKDNKIEQGNEELVKATKEENYSLIVETSDGQRKLRRRRGKRIYDDSDDEEQQKKNKCKVAPVFVKSLPKTKVEDCTDAKKDLTEKTDPIDQEMKEHEDVEENNDKLEQEKEENDCLILEPNDSGRQLRRRRSKPVYDDFVYDYSDDEEKQKKSKRKVAPVFLKSMPKPKLDPAAVESRRQFLLSGVPSSLRKEMERQQSNEEIEFDVFPAISHIQQKSPDWELPKATLNLKSPDSWEIPNLKPFTKQLLSWNNPDAPPFLEAKKIKNFKKIVKDIKTRHPEYPVFKIFNSLFAKSGNNLQQTKKRGRPKQQKSPENVDALWTEKYKPLCSEEILGNNSAICSLKKWLSFWLNGKDKRAWDSESEFDVTEFETRVGNTVLVKGPSGSGKTAAVYAICNELGFSVLEVNASSKRTGKRLLQELQEATQSHQVCKKESVLSTFVSGKKVEKPQENKCVLLIEDVDIAYEQDEGFISALSQIIASSKRPVILTATDEPSIKLIDIEKIIKFSPLYTVLTIWLQIVCLVEGYYVNQKSLDDILTYNKGDIRRTLLQLQLFVSSGGSPDPHQILNETHELHVDDVTINDDIDQGDNSDLQIHSNVLESCHPVKNLETRWWNFPKPESDVIDSKENLKSLLRCYDAFSVADVISGKGGRMETKDSLCLDERFDFYRDVDFQEELIGSLLEGRVNLVKSEVKFNMAQPTSSHRKWRSKLLGIDEKLRDAVLFRGEAWKTCLVVDYLPILRQMARDDFKMMKSSTKRGNRFFSYLKGLGVRCTEANYKVICDVFKITE